MPGLFSVAQPLPEVSTATLGSAEKKSCILVNFLGLFVACRFFFKINFYKKNSFSNTIRVLNS